VVRRQPHRIELEVDVDVAPIETVIQAALHSGQLRDLTVQDPPMDDVVRAIYAHADRGASS
jgi:ABC-type uncharacterized transport system ATPase subunit